MGTKREKRFNLTVCFFVVAVIIVIILLLMIIFNGEKSEDVRITGGGKSTSLECTDSRRLHPALRDRTPISHTNTITATFSDDALSSITLYYVGTYNSSAEAEQAEAYAQADYGLIPAKEMHINVEPFSHSFMTNGDNVSMTITAKNSDIDDKTAPYFLLDQGKAFPRSRSSMKQRYEEKGFSCKIVD